MKSASKILRKRYGLKKAEKRGKWQRDPWLRILELLSKMTYLVWRLVRNESKKKGC